MFKLFRETVNDKANIAVYKPLIEDVYLSLDELGEKIYSSLWFGTSLYNSKKVELTKVYSKEFFENNYSSIIKAYKGVGTYEAFITVLKGIYGSNAEITFEVPQPAVLNINVVQSNVFAYWQEKNTSNLIVDKEGDNLVFKIFFSDLQPEQALKILNSLTISGIVTTFSIEVSQEAFQENPPTLLSVNGETAYQKFLKRLKAIKGV